MMRVKNNFRHIIHHDIVLLRTSSVAEKVPALRLKHYIVYRKYNKYGLCNPYKYHKWNKFWNNNVQVN